MGIAARIASADWRELVLELQRCCSRSNHHNGDIIRVCRQLSVHFAVKPLATVPNRPNKVCKARLQALQRYLDTQSDGNIV